MALAVVASLPWLGIGVDPVFGATYYWNTTLPAVAPFTDFNTPAAWSDNAISGGTTGTVPTIAHTVVYNQSTVNGNFTTTTTTSPAALGVVFRNTGTTTLVPVSSNLRTITIGTGGLTVNAGAGNVSFGGSARPQTVALSGSQGWANESSSILSVNAVNNGSAVPFLGNSSAATPATLTFNGSGAGATNVGIQIRDNSTNATAGAFSIRVNTSGSGVTTFSNRDSLFTGGVQISGGIAAATTTAGATGSVTVAATNGPLGAGPTLINGGQLNTIAANALLGSSTVTMTSGELRATAATSLATAAAVTLGGGTLRGFNAATINYGGGTFNVTGNTTVINERSGTASATSINMTFGSALNVSGSQLDVTGTDNQTGGTSTVTFGAGALNGNGKLRVTKNPSATNSTVLAFSTLNVTGSGNEIVAGNGTVSVSGATTVAGALRVNGALTATGGVAVSSTGSIGGTGTISGAVGVAGTLSPGNSPGTLTVSGADLTFSDGGQYNWQVYDAAGAAGTGYDSTAVLGAGQELDLSGLTTTFSINLWSLSGVGPDVNGNAIGFDNSTAASWTLVSTPSVITSFDASKFTITTAAANGTGGFGNALAGGTFSVELGDGNTDLLLTFAPAVPEPTSLAAMSLIAAGLLGRRRR